MHYSKIIWLVLLSFVSQVKAQEAIDNVYDTYPFDQSSQSYAWLVGEEFKARIYSTVYYSGGQQEKTLDQEIPLGYTGGPAITLLLADVYFNELKYTTVILDTMNTNSGCCPCHYPDRAERFVLDEIDHSPFLRVHLVHQVFELCNSITHHYEKVYPEIDKLILDKRANSQSIDAVFRPNTIRDKQ